MGLAGDRMTDVTRRFLGCKEPVTGSWQACGGRRPHIRRYDGRDGGGWNEPWD